MFSSPILRIAGHFSCVFSSVWFSLSTYSVSIAPKAWGLSRYGVYLSRYLSKHFFSVQLFPIFAIESTASTLYIYQYTEARNATEIGYATTIWNVLWFGPHSDNNNVKWKAPKSIWLFVYFLFLNGNSNTSQYESSSATPLTAYTRTISKTL